MITGYAVFGYKGNSSWLPDGAALADVEPIVLYISLTKRKAEQFKKENKDAFFIETVQINNPIFQGTVINTTIQILGETV